MEECLGDTYFLDRNTALRIACLQQEVVLKSGKTVTQICYYDGEPFRDAPGNLINVPVSIFLDYFSKNTLRLPVEFCCRRQGVDPETEKSLVEQFNDIIDGILDGMKKGSDVDPKQSQIYCDTYFIDRQTAYEVALQRNRVSLGHPSIDGLQICYHDGEPFENAPENLVNVPTSMMVTFFTETRLRLPRKIVLPPSIPQDRAIAIFKTFKEILQKTDDNRTDIARNLAGINKKRKPASRPGEPLRIFLPASRKTQVMQYCSKNMGKAFAELGCHAWISLEENDMEELSPLWILQEFHDFDPDVILHINHLNNSFLHPDVINVTWWQDAMQPLLQGDTLPWRETDLAYTVMRRHFKKWLTGTGLEEDRVHIQPMCIDPDVFHADYDVERENKIIFIGSSGINHLLKKENEKEFLDLAISRFETGEVFTYETISALAREYKLNPDYAYHHLLYYISRDLPVRWICRQNFLDVEIYGRHWQEDEIVAPFFKGELPHGEAVARVYNSAKYTLSCHWLNIQMTRLVEAGACGCIPLVYDCRVIAEPPFWEEYSLFFKTEDELHKSMQQEKPTNPQEFIDYYAYINFAKRILKDIKKIQDSKDQ